LIELGVEAPFYVMQSNGGLSSITEARERPVYLIESGPAAGVIATRALVRESDIASAIAFDMGGTTAKATLIEDGEAAETSQYEVGAGMNATRGLNTGRGHTVLTSTLDIAEVGAGGEASCGSTTVALQGSAREVQVHRRDRRVMEGEASFRPLLMPPSCWVT
jgi:N-methylhydantoinase A